jgi:hypothetical protein
VSEVAALRVVRGELFDAGDDARTQGLFRAVLDILFTLGQFDELIDAADLAFRSADRVGNFSDAARDSAIKACTHAIRGESAPARDAYTLGSVAAESSGLPESIARLKRCRAFLHYRSREPREALATIEGVEGMSRDAGDHTNLVDTLDLRTAANWYLRSFGECEAAAHQSMEASAAANWGRARAYPLRYLAELATQRRESQRAHALLDEAHEIAARFADKRQLARVDLSRARLCLIEGELEVGSSASARAVSEARRLGLSAELEESIAVCTAIERAQRSWLWRHYYRLRRPTRLTGAPVGGD